LASHYMKLMQTLAWMKLTKQYLLIG
jgi:hypothetical protein